MIDGNRFSSGREDRQRDRDGEQCRRPELLRLLRCQHVLERRQRHVGEEIGRCVRVLRDLPRLEVALDRLDRLGCRVGVPAQHRPGEDRLKAGIAVRSLLDPGLQGGPVLIGCIAGVLAFREASRGAHLLVALRFVHRRQLHGYQPSREIVAARVGQREGVPAGQQ